MNKFTIFTIILAVSVVTVTVDLAARDYFGENGDGQASVVDSDVPDEVQQSDTKTEAKTDAAAATPAVAEPYTPPIPSAIVTADKIKQAGFTGEFVEQHFNGKIFQLLDITKIPVDAIGFYEIRQEGNPVVSVAEIAFRDEIRALQMYVLLQNKTKPYIDLSLNETNAYGDRSFYINHAKKTEEAFLTVKIGKMIYSFAYVKPLHPEIKKLVQLLIP